MKICNRRWRTGRFKPEVKEQVFFITEAMEQDNVITEVKEQVNFITEIEEQDNLITEQSTALPAHQPPLAVMTVLLDYLHWPLALDRTKGWLSSLHYSGRRSMARLARCGLHPDG